MIAQFRTAKDVLDKRNRLIRKGNNPKDLLIIRLKCNTWLSNCPLFRKPIMDTKERKEKKPSKKILIGKIEKLDTNKDFNLLSLTRTNIDNLIIIRNLLKGV